MMTILLERQKYLRATHLPWQTCLGDGGRIEKLWASLVDNLLPLTALLLKGQSVCEIPAAKIWPPTQGLVRVCIRPNFSERPTEENTRAMLKFGLIAG